MKQIGREFFHGISNYDNLLNDFKLNLDVQFMSKQRIEEDPKKRILVLLYLTEHPKYSVHLLNIFHKYKIEYFPDIRKGWITAFTYDRPQNTFCLKRHGDSRYIDLFRISSLEKTHFAHRKGFVAIVKKYQQRNYTLIYSMR